MQVSKEELNKLSNRIIGIAIEIHKKLGPGLAEKIYKKILETELRRMGLAVEREKRIVIMWNGREIGYQIIDFIVNNEIILEIKVTSELSQLHQAQLLSYLKVAEKRLGLLLNFGESILNIKRVVNNL